METNGNKWKQMETQKKCPFFGFTNWLTGLHHNSLNVSKSADCIAPFCSFLLLFAPFCSMANPCGNHGVNLHRIPIKTFFIVIGNPVSQIENFSKRGIFVYCKSLMV
jgi:hypothetical protein